MSTTTLERPSPVASFDLDRDLDIEELDDGGAAGGRDGQVVRCCCVPRPEDARPRSAREVASGVDRCSPRQQPGRPHPPVRAGRGRHGLAAQLPATAGSSGDLAPRQRHDREPAGSRREARPGSAPAGAPSFTRILVHPETGVMNQSHEWQEDGRSRYHNLASLYAPDPRLKSQTNWTVSRLPTGVFAWTSPSGLGHRSDPAVPFEPLGVVADPSPS